MFKRYFVFVVLGLHHSYGLVSASPEPGYIEDSALPRTRVRRLSGVPKPVWHVGVYFKSITPYFYACGGSVVTNDVIISTASCFQPFDTPANSSRYAVAGNKNYWPWDDENDADAQKSDVKEIIPHPEYHGFNASLQFNIAVVRLATPFRYTRGLRPVCVDFDEEFEATQLRDGNRGTFAGYGLTGPEVGNYSRRLLWWETPYVSLERCFASVNTSFYQYLTADKFCAGENNTGKAVCLGDSGGGLVFWRGRTVRAVPYFRGVLSTAPSSWPALCNLFTVAAYTRVSASKRFLLEAVPGLDQDCQFKLTKPQVQEGGPPLR